jgi:hypothetical protein
MTILERVARAACEKHYSVIDWEWESEDFRAGWIALARAGLQALRKPNRNMMAAARDFELTEGQLLATGRGDLDRYD